MNIYQNVKWIFKLIKTVMINNLYQLYTNLSTKQRGHSTFQHIWKSQNYVKPNPEKNIVRKKIQQYPNKHRQKIIKKIWIRDTERVILYNQRKLS